MTTGSYQWETPKKMFETRVFATPIIHNDDIYVIGGCDQKGTPLDSFERYETAKKKWHRLPQMLTKRASPGVGVIDNKIIVIGGVSETQEPLSDVEVYDIDAKKWTKLESLKEGLLGVQAVVRDRKILIAGGMSNDTNPRDTFWEFEFEPNKWKSLPPMDAARYAAFAFLINDKLYIIGGRQGKLPSLAFEVFDFATNKWERLPDVPSKRVFAMYAANDTHIFSVGGLNQPADTGFSDACEVFDLEKKEWFLGTPMPTKRGDFAMGVVGPKLICAGGLGNTGKPLDMVEAYDWKSNTWTQLQNIPTAHCSCASLMKDGRLHVIGGLSLGGSSSRMESIGFKPDPPPSS